MPEHKYGCKKDRHDVRDFLFRGLRLDVELPPSTDNRVFHGPVKDQDGRGACTGYGWMSQMELEFRKFLKETPIFSSLWLYYMERKEEGTLPDDAGAESRTGPYCITKYGLALESEWPSDPSRFNVEPTQEVMAQALARRTGGYHRITSLADLKTCLADQGLQADGTYRYPGHAFNIGIPLFESFESSAVDRTGMVPLPKSPEAIIGYHELMVADYDDTVQCPEASPGAVLFQNSWGDQWGCRADSTSTRGFGWLSYDYLARYLYQSDYWILHPGRPW